jgi:hypothetical protein
VLFSRNVRTLGNEKCENASIFFPRYVDEDVAKATVGNNAVPVPAAAALRNALRSIAFLLALIFCCFFYA